MNPSSRGARSFLLNSDNICISCRRTLQHRRQYASAAAAVADTPEPTLPSSTEPHAPPQPSPFYRVKAGVLLCRAPLLTRDLHPFEKAYFQYQRRMNERLALPFQRYFYYPAGTPGETEWKRKMKLRKGPARDIGPYHAHGEYAWNDEALVGAPYGELEHQQEVLIQDAEFVGRRVGEAEAGEEEEGQEAQAVVATKKTQMERPMPRITKEDRENDQTSLNRMLDRALYLLVKNADGRWSFPAVEAKPGELFRKASERALEQAAGVNMNTWHVGNHPVGHFTRHTTTPKLSVTDDGKVELGEKVFFLKARIMAGQADLSATKLGLTEFKWLAKEEIQGLVTPQYWSQTENMLTAR